MRKKRLYWGLLTILLMGVAGFEAPRLARSAGPTGSRDVSHEVVIDNFTFGPQTLTVPAKTKVTWINRDDVPHTVVSTEKKFKSSALDTDEQFSFTFDQPGSYEYFCSVHPKMTGKIVVE